MPLALQCSSGKKMKVRDDLAGKKVKCPGCGGVLVVSRGSQEVTAVAPMKVKAAPPPLPEQEEAPRKKTREPAEDEKKPLRKGYPCWRCKSSSPFGLLTLGEEGLY